LGIQRSAEGAAIFAAMPSQSRKVGRFSANDCREGYLVARSFDRGSLGGARHAVTIRRRIDQISWWTVIFVVRRLAYAGQART
jgi:hypothetical protein